MNPSLNALMTKLNWQLNELNLHLQGVQQKMHELEQKIHEINVGMNQSEVRSLMINPELEINRLNFVTQQQEQKDILLLEFKNHQSIELQLEEKTQRTKTELKMLEKYLERGTKTEQEHQKKAHDNAMDEWVLQKRESI